MSNIISDISKRVLIVKGFEEVKRIAEINQDERIMKVKYLENDIWNIELISRVGDYYNKSVKSETHMLKW